MDSHLFYELLGYVASGLVAVSLLMRSILRLRVLNLIGAVCFTIYGLLIAAYPVAAVNFIIILINLYYLREMFGTQEYFRLLSVSPRSDYLYDFLEFYGEEIGRFVPGFTFEPGDDTAVFFVLRDMVPAGLVIARPETADTLRIDLDYAIPGYRDFKIGRFVYGPHSPLLQKKAVRRVISEAETTEHSRYLQRMGFKRQENGRFYQLDLPQLK